MKSGSNGWKKDQVASSGRRMVPVVLQCRRLIFVKEDYKMVSERVLSFAVAFADHLAAGCSAQSLLDCIIADRFVNWYIF